MAAAGAGLRGPGGHGPGARGAEVVARGWGWRHVGRRAHAVRGLDLHLHPGERVLLLGPSGAGKSTLLAGLAGLLDGDGEVRHEGSLTVDGLPVRHPDLRGRVGLVLQDPQAQTILQRCGDDVAFGCENLAVPRSEIWARVDRALEAVGLDVGRDRSTEALSGGQRQRLALAGVVAMSPSLLLLDEPTANLDPEGVVEVRDAVSAVLDQTGATMVVVEHQVGTWLDVVTRVVVLEPGGGVVADGTPEAVLGRYGASLAAAGVWVPGHPPEVLPRRAGPAQHEVLLLGEGLAVRPPGGAVAAAGIDVQVRAGACLAVEGVNGAGKSTLAMTLAGLLPPAAGEVIASPALASGARPRRAAWHQRVRRTRGARAPHTPPVAPWQWRSADLPSRIGMVFQDPEHQFLTGSVREELRHGPRLLGLPEAEVEARADELLERLRLTRLAGANPFTLSGGEKRRLSVATALATRPRVLILDEPTFGQDRLTWAGVVGLLRELVEAGAGVVVVTHDGGVVEALADDRLVLSPAALEVAR